MSGPLQGVRVVEPAAIGPASPRMVACPSRPSTRLSSSWRKPFITLSTMMSDGAPPFKTLLGHGTVNDQFGKAMHKSDGNSIELHEAPA